MTAGPTYLGVDAGTSVVKAVLLDETGAALVVNGRDLGLQHGEGRPGRAGRGRGARAVGDVVGAVLEQARGRRRRPDLVAVTAQGDGCWLVDADHHPVRPAVSWLDGRAADLVADWTDAGSPKRSTGSTAPPCSRTPAPILAWLDRHEPDVLDRAESAGYCKDVILGRLTGLRATDPSDSSVPFGDGTGEAYSDEILRLCGLGHRRDLLAPIESPAPQAAVHADGAALTGLAVGTPVVAGPFDFPACASGRGSTSRATGC